MDEPGNILKSIKDRQFIKIPRRAPVMVLPNTLLFPEALLPLFIFEPRYREMLEWVLKNDRVFCMALLRRGREDWSSPEDFHDVAGLGLVRACVAQPDGTSHLILQGIARVEFTEFVQTEPFVIANIRELPESRADADEAATLSAIVLELCALHRANGLVVSDVLDQQLAQVRDAGALSDLVAYALIRDPYRRQSVLEAGDVAERLRTLIALLRDALP